MIAQKKIEFYNINNFKKIKQLANLSDEQMFDFQVVSSVLPFRSNNYVVDELINWDNIPDDPIYQLTFPQRGMLTDEHFKRVADAILSKDKVEINKVVSEVRKELNPHPAGQISANTVHGQDGEVVPGVQHKYTETVLVFPSAGQTCHAYCTFCFRWAQFVGDNSLKFATDESMKFQGYLKRHKEVTDVLFTGGDPMVMSAKKLKIYLAPLLSPEFDHIKNIRIGSKSLTYWPYKYVNEPETEELLKLFEKITNSGKHLAFMAHFNHGVELSTQVLKKAVKNLRDVGVEIRTQSPLIKHINDNSNIWVKMWKEQVRLGMIPYYFFIERDTGSKNYFEVSLAKAFEIYQEAFKKVSGLVRTVRGPSMSAFPGKVSIDGIVEIYGEKLFVLNFIQARNADWVKKPFFAKYDNKATWLTNLKPGLGKKKFFYEDELNEMLTITNTSSKNPNLDENLVG